MSDPPKRPALREPDMPAMCETLRPPPVEPSPATGAYAIGDLAREFDISTRAIRFYESRGLLRPERRGTVRVFGPADRQRLSLIIRAKNLGLSLEEIGEHLAIFDAAPSSGDPKALKARADRQIALLLTKRHDLAQALRDLRRISSDLSVRLARSRPPTR